MSCIGNRAKQPPPSKQCSLRNATTHRLETLAAMVAIGADGTAVSWRASWKRQVLSHHSPLRQSWGCVADDATCRIWGSSVMMERFSKPGHTTIRGLYTTSNSRILPIQTRRYYNSKWIQISAQTNMIRMSFHLFSWSPICRSFNCNVYFLFLLWQLSLAQASAARRYFRLGHFAGLEHRCSIDTSKQMLHMPSCIVYNCIIIYIYMY